MKDKIALIFLTFFIVIALACKRSVEAPPINPSPTFPLVPPAVSTLLPSLSPTALPTATQIPIVQIQVGQKALSDGDWENALHSFETALEASEERETQASALIGIGRSWLFARNYYEAVRPFERIIAEYSDSSNLPKAYFFLGQAQQGLEQYSLASEAYLNYLILRSGVIDAYVLEMRGDVLFAAGDYGSAANDYRASIQSPSLSDEIQLQLKIARAYALAGDHGTALSLYDEVFLRTDNEYTRALIDLRKGQSFTALGQTEQAQSAFLDAVQNYPRAYESYTALVSLLEAGYVVDELQRGMVDYYAGEYAVALAAFERYLLNNPPDPATGHYFNGLTHRALGGSTDAIEQWEIILQNYPQHHLWDDAWEQKGYTQWAFLEQYPEAVQTLLEFVERVPDHPRAGEFLFDAAQVAERNGDLSQAAMLWERVVNQHPTDERAGRALFLSAISQYRQGDYASSLTSFQRFQSLAITLLDRSAASFWIGKSQFAAGDQAAALQTWETTASIDPTGYYSERARDILHNQEPFSPPEGYDLARDILSERIKADEWLRMTFGLPIDSDLSGLGSLANDPHLVRGKELWELGLYEKARNEFDQLRTMVETDPELSYRLANFLLEIGAYRPAILTTRQVLNLALMDDASTLSAPIYFNHVRFGTFYDNLIIPLSEAYGFHPLFLFSVTRQESLFEAYVYSSAGAMGLMQIIPTTGADIVRNLGWPENYSNQDLLRPLVNLTLGVDYLDTQRNNFDGNLYAALAAYNGGPGNANAWVSLAPQDQDLFLEVIRFEETRNYIRGIYELFSIYRFIYNRSS